MTKKSYMPMDFMTLYVFEHRSNEQLKEDILMPISHYGKIKIQKKQALKKTKMVLYLL